MKKFFVVVAVLSCMVSAYAQPDGPGLAQLPELPRIPPAPRPGAPGPPGAPGAPDANGEFRAATRAAYNRINNPAEKIDLSSPEATVRSFVWSFWNADLKLTRQCVESSLPYEKLVENERKMQHDFLEGPGDTKVLISDVHSYIDGDKAIVTLRAIVILGNVPPLLLSTSERFQLRRVNNDCLIRPAAVKVQGPGAADNHEIPDDRMPVDLLVNLVQVVVDPALALNENSFSKCQMNLKQIALGIMQFTQDWDEKFPFEPDWQKQIFPYVKNEAVFHCPEVPKNETSYAFNPELIGKTLANMNAPAQTIMIYEGKEQKFEYRHQNKTMTNIAFADGHVKAYSQESLETALKNGQVTWKP